MKVYTLRSYMCRISSASFVGRWRDHLVHESRVPDPHIHQMDVDLQGEHRIRAAQPLRDLLHVAARLESREAEGVECHLRKAGGFDRWNEHATAEIPVG
jgi:hypothetical protein